jgi:hypothetical protein
MNLKQIGAKYSLFDSVEEMLAPETLGKLLSRPVTYVDCEPMNGHVGLAGGQLSHVDTNVCRLVLKRMSIEFDYIMFATADEQCRCVMVWQYGLLDRLCPHLEHKIVACAHGDGIWAILMHDLRDGLLVQGMRQSLPSLCRYFSIAWQDCMLRFGTIHS